VSPVWRLAVRPAAVAGSFYPGGAVELAAVVDALLERARLRASEGACHQRRLRWWPRTPATSTRAR
jgi:hypothetical protein